MDSKKSGAPSQGSRSNALGYLAPAPAEQLDALLRLLQGYLLSADDSDRGLGLQLLGGVLASRQDPCRALGRQLLHGAARHWGDISGHVAEGLFQPLFAAERPEACRREALYAVPQPLWDEWWRYTCNVVVGRLDPRRFSGPDHADVTQNAMVQFLLLVSRGRFDANHPIRGALAMLGRTRAAEYARSPRRGERPNGLLEEVLASPAEEARFRDLPASDQSYWVEVIRCAIRAMEGQPGQAWQAYLAVWDESRSFPEGPPAPGTAESLSGRVRNHLRRAGVELSAKALSMALSRGRKQLREVLRRLEFPFLQGGRP
jgi:hypothetical protein